ncbi:hypothetical protein JX580_00455 [Thiomicrospira microaerophila]|uniref:hypothetical protein n=1 Tax=Thiomicrospira microaerophila TaxID=406020 RepID=UPI00201047FA|nr:hypothetical protein [Thiomicrospira microaerophila]UQB42421.1 hypothetical protein JX580_00455 [Thiomicrospira microaerophila]
MYAIEFEADLNSEYLRIPEFDKLKNQHVKVIVLAENIETSLTQKTADLSSVYDFSDLVGKLEWQGAALAQQENLRNEW